MRQFSSLEQRLLNEFQHGMPLTPNPYADIARQLGVYETTVLETLQRLQTEGVISRVGAVFRPNRIGASTLAAIAIPVEELEEVWDLLESIFQEVESTLDMRQPADRASMEQKDAALRELAADLNVEQTGRIRDDSSKTRLSILFYAIVGNAMMLSKQMVQLLEIFEEAFCVGDDDGGPCGPS